jgi:N-acetyltransferase
VGKLISSGSAWCMFGGAAYSPSAWGSPVNAATNLALLGHAFEDCAFGRVMLQTGVP